MLRAVASVGNVFGVCVRVFTRPPKTLLNLLPHYFMRDIWNDACRFFTDPRVVNGNNLFTAGDLQVSLRNTAINNIQ